MAILRKTYTALFFIGLFFIPFNSYEGVGFLGEFSRESSFLFFTSGLVLYLLYAWGKNKVLLPLKNEIFIYIIIFVFYCFLTSILNSYNIFQSYFKHTSGIIRFLKQYLVLVVSGVFLLIYYLGAFKKYTTEVLLLKVRKVLLYSFILVWIYALIEILIVVFKKDYLLSLLHLFDYFPFTEVRLDLNNGRISSVSFEPPFLAIYLITIAAWMFSYILTSKSWLRFLPTIGVVLLTYFSGSRTALIVIGIQLLCFLGVVLHMKKYRKYILYLATLMFSGFIFVIIITRGGALTAISDKLSTLNFKENLTKSVSNKTRFGMQYANLKVFEEHPIFGVGFGQQAFYSREHYPLWATKDNYEFELMYLNEEERSFPPGFNLYIRLLAETGVLGLLMFLILLWLAVVKLKRAVKYEEGLNRVMAIVLLVSIVGYIINWMQIDTFRIFGFWVCIALLIHLQKEKKQSGKVFRIEKI